MATNSHDPRPQAVIRTVSGTGETEPRGPYVDQSITTRNPPDATLPDDPLRSGAKTLGNIRRFYAEDQVEEVDQDATNPAATPPEHAPMGWAIETTDDGISRSRDPYRNAGMIGQDFLEQE